MYQIRVRGIDKRFVTPNLLTLIASKQIKGLRDGITD
jgi:hypothetical protein